MNFLQNFHFIHSTYSTLYLIAIELLIAFILFFVTFAFLGTKKQNFTDDIEIEAIAGEDVMVTQLDLARAYIEMDNKPLAKEILDQVLKKGNPNQKHEAQQLIAEIELS